MEPSRYTMSRMYNSGSQRNRMEEAKRKSKEVWGWMRHVYDLKSSFVRNVQLQKREAYSTDPGRTHKAYFPIKVLQSYRLYVVHIIWTLQRKNLARALACWSPVQVIM
jgi:hypothetical protein